MLSLFEITVIEPLSTRKLVDSQGGTQVSGRQRAKVQNEIEDALGEAYIAGWALYGEERAAAILLHICARDPRFEPPDWLRELWALYRDEMRSEFHGTADDGETDWSEERDEGGGARSATPTQSGGVHHSTFATAGTCRQHRPP